MKRTWDRDDESHCSVAIIGGGFTGTLLAAELLSRNSAASVTLIDPASLPGRGIAYSTSCSWHLLNVPAGNMSALADRPDHFVHWARSNYNSDVRAEDFLPRSVYGHYVQSILCNAILRNGERFRILRDECVRIDSEDGIALVHLASGKTISAAHVVLAMGNFQPASSCLPGVSAGTVRYVACGWKITVADFEKLAEEENVLLVGSGLTAVDIAIGLRAHEFTGTLHILSRHGLLPQGHEEGTAVVETWDAEFPHSLRALMKMVRRRIRVAEDEGYGWREVIDSLRPVTADIWQSLPHSERRRFLRHLRPYWDVHRHRIAPAINSQIQVGIANGGIQVHAGRITDYREDTDAAVVTYRDRKRGELKNLRAGRVINCTTPETDCRKVASPLLRDLLRRGLVQPDALFLGFDADEDGTIIDAAGERSDFLFTLGPSLKGKLWESIAVPEIRVQIANLAERLTEDHLRMGRSVTVDWQHVASTEREVLDS